jgi:hypothetical protein
VAEGHLECRPRSCTTQIPYHLRIPNMPLAPLEENAESGTGQRVRSDNTTARRAASSQQPD